MTNRLNGPMDSGQRRVRQLAVVGLVTGIILAVTKLIAGLLGHSYALVADSVESVTDIAASVVVWGGLRYAAREPDAEHPYGHGRAESLAAAAVALMILAAGIGVGVQAVRELLRPQAVPEWWTLLVLGVVIVVKEALFRVVSRAATESGSPASRADAWHHRSDAITSLAACIGVGIAVAAGPGFERADDWAALFAALIIVLNGVLVLAAPVNELMDRQEPMLLDRAGRIAADVPGVDLVQRVRSRRTGNGVWLDMHIWVNGAMPVREAHAVSHAVKDAIRAQLPDVRDVLIHIEPTSERTV